jgi:D-alanyl-D-alanine carboxypeptidase (penicillin-binding protein 5/6)
MKRFLCFLLIFVIMLPFCAFATEIDGEPPVDDIEEPKVLAETARHALVYETLSGQFLFEKNIHERASIASLTKIMTALLVIEYGGFDEMVTANETAYGDLSPLGSTQNIVPGEIMSVEHLLYCAMISSANEATNILAEHIAGSVEAFVAMMNDRARELGCLNTNFVNTHGLTHDDHYSTAYDVLLMTQEAMKHPKFVELVNITAMPVPATNKSEGRALYTTNHLISRRTHTTYIYHLAQGIKTGYTARAGFCLVSSATHNGLSLITIVMGCERIDGIVYSFVETKELMEWTFETFSYRVILRATDEFFSVGVELGKGASEVNVKPSRSLTALVPKDLDNADIERKITLPDSVTAPVTRGQALGEITLSYGNTIYGTIPLVADFEVELSQEESVIQDIMEIVQRPWIRYAVIAIVAVILLYIAVVLVYNYKHQKYRARGNYRGKRRRRK